MKGRLARRLQRRIDELLRVLELARPQLRRSGTPCFAHLRIESGGRVKDVLLANETRAGAEVSVIDWQSAPLAEVFFSCAEGEEYELEVAGHQVTGRLLERNLLRFGLVPVPASDPVPEPEPEPASDPDPDPDGGEFCVAHRPRPGSGERELLELQTPKQALRRQAGGGWREIKPVRAPRLRPRPEKLRRRPSSPADVELDTAQRRIVSLPPGRTALVLGEAGFGKTTVALHRLSHLRRTAAARGRCAVIVPTEGLRRLTQSLLERMGVAGVEVALYDLWAGQQARRAFPGLPGSDSQDTSAGVIRLKRHPALRPVLAVLARQPPALLDDEPSRPGRRAALATRADLLHLFGDGALMRQVAAGAHGDITAGAVAEVLEHTHVQFSQTAEEEYAHVDRERLVTLDGRTLDEGTPTEDARTLDAEDFAVLFELDRLRAENRGLPATAPRRYDCLVIDEAQELAPLELALIGRSLAPGGTLVVAGDAGQQVDPTTSFAGWPATMEALGAGDYETAELEVSYRCPPEVTALARTVLGRGGEAPAAAGGPVTFAPLDNPCHLAAWLIDALRELHEQDPRASVAVICRAPEAAVRLARNLRRGVGVRLALDGDFRFGAGVTVTCVQEAKGLEFDYVIVPDASSAAYPDNPESRRALYVAVTRASQQLVLACSGARTPLVG